MPIRPERIITAIRMNWRVLPAQPGAPTPYGAIEYTISDEMITFDVCAVEALILPANFHLPSHKDNPRPAKIILRSGVEFRIDDEAARIVAASMGKFHDTR